MQYSAATIGKVMSTPVHTVVPDDPMEQVKSIFETHRVHHIPVVEDGRVVGIISKSDYLYLLHSFSLFKSRTSELFNQAVLRSLLVSEVMTRQVVTVGVNDSLQVAADIFRENYFHALPVVDKDDRLQGIVTTYDLINYAFPAVYAG